MRKVTMVMLMALMMTLAVWHSFYTNDPKEYTATGELEEDTYWLEYQGGFLFVTVTTLGEIMDDENIAIIKENHLKYLETVR